jgi:hypothetical protein
MANKALHRMAARHAAQQFGSQEEAAIGELIVSRRHHTPMTYELFFAGVGTTILGTLLGVWLAPRITHPFQKQLMQEQLKFQQRLLDQQLEFEKQQAQADAAHRQQMHTEQLEAFKEFRNMINIRAARGNFGGAARSPHFDEQP